jgi:hypothetical protein
MVVVQQFAALKSLRKRWEKDPPSLKLRRGILRSANEGYHEND